MTDWVARTKVPSTSHLAQILSAIQCKRPSVIHGADCVCSPGAVKTEGRKRGGKEQKRKEAGATGGSKEKQVARGVNKRGSSRTFISIIIFVGIKRR